MIITLSVVNPPQDHSSDEFLSDALTQTESLSQNTNYKVLEHQTERVMKQRSDFLILRDWRLYTFILFQQKVRLYFRIKLWA